MKVYNLQFNNKAMQTWMLMRQTAVLCEQLAEQTLLDTGLTPETVTVLAILDKAKEPVIPAELARYTSRTNQTIAGMLNRMDKTGLVTRDKKRKEHPYTEVIITAKGKKTVKDALPVYTKLIDNMGALLTPKGYDMLQASLEIIRDEAAARMRLKVVSKKNKC